MYFAGSAMRKDEVIPVHAMKAYRGVKEYIHLFLT